MLDRIGLMRVKGRKLQRGEFRASNADREDAFRRLEAHRSMGHLDQDELPGLYAAVEAAATPNQIGEVFAIAGLPTLPARSPSTERRVSAPDRAEAIGLLEKAYAEGRLEAHECAAAKDQVSAARTRSEIDGAFHGLSTASRVAAAKTATDLAEQTAGLTRRAIGESGRRARRAFRHGVFALAALMIGVILLIAGIGTAALVCFVGAVLLFVSAAVSLVKSQSSA